MGEVVDAFFSATEVGWSCTFSSRRHSRSWQQSSLCGQAPWCNGPHVHCDSLRVARASRVLAVRPGAGEQLGSSAPLPL